MRIVRKVVRGLAHHHRIATAVPEADVWADVLRYAIPSTFEGELIQPNVHDPKVFTYRYCHLREPDVHSGWLLTFYESCTFIGVIGPGIAARHAA
jgi:hypothetical protein